MIDNIKTSASAQSELVHQISVAIEAQYDRILMKHYCVIELQPKHYNEWRIRDLYGSRYVVSYKNTDVAYIDVDISNHKLTVSTTPIKQ